MYDVFICLSEIFLPMTQSKFQCIPIVKYDLMSNSYTVLKIILMKLQWAELLICFLISQNQSAEGTVIQQIKKYGLAATVTGPMTKYCISLHNFLWSPKRSFRSFMPRPFYGISTANLFVNCTSKHGRTFWVSKFGEFWMENIWSRLV